MIDFKMSIFNLNIGWRFVKKTYLQSKFGAFLLQLYNLLFLFFVLTVC